MEAFGSKGNNCQICRKEDVVSSNSRYRSRDIIRHFIKYHQDFMLETLDSDEARDVVTDALRDSRGTFLRKSTTADEVQSNESVL